MAIDLPVSSQLAPRGNQNPVNQLVNQRQDTLQAALKALNLKAGETVEALVKTVRQVDPQLRSRLLQFTTPVTDTVSNSAPRNPTAQQQLVLAPKLSLAELNVRGQSLLVYTDKPLKPQQSFVLQLGQDGFFTATTTPGPQAKNTNEPQGLLTPAQKQTLLAALRDQLPRTPTAATHRASLQATAAANQGYPPSPCNQGQTDLSDNLLGIRRFSQWLQTPANIGLKHQFPLTLQDSLRHLATMLRSPDQLSQPGQLKSALLNSGLLLESKLAKATNLPDPAHRPKLLQQDLKAALLHTLQQLKQSMHAPPSTDPAITTTLAPLLKQLKQSHQNTGRPPDIRVQQWLALLHSAVSRSLDSLQLCQLQSLQHALETSAQTAHLDLEIPIRYGHELQQMTLKIEEDWLTQYPDDPEKTSEQVRQWKVKLAFELPDAGSFNAHMTVCGAALSASLWLEDPATYARTRASLDQLATKLAKDGCQVRSIECLLGRPPEAATRLSYALVDTQA